MDYGLMISMAGNALAVVAMGVLTAKLATARQDQEDTEEAHGDLKITAALLRDANRALLDDLTPLRAKEAKRVKQRAAALDKAREANAARAAGKASNARAAAH